MRLTETASNENAVLCLKGRCLHDLFRDVFWRTPKARANCVENPYHINIISLGCLIVKMHFNLTCLCLFVDYDFSFILLSPFLNFNCSYCGMLKTTLTSLK